MSNVKCIELGCPHYISDPCVKVTGLFQIRTELLSRQQLFPEDLEIQKNIESVDTLVTKELGLTDVKTHHEAFQQQSRTSVHLFTLVCVLNHKHQYNIQC